MNHYAQRIRDAHAAGVFPAGEVVTVSVAHGPGCQHHLNRKTPCTCFPLVTAIVGGEVLTLGTGGAVLDRKKLI
jgi:hypothetical protein